ncbi:succinate dehydrogenase cytochrome b subunit [Candidatus Kapabacteria bacterium]|nr:succinate dehydrogenase cytochrome b subunit [Candidatus Kapabacteria bacterium]
MVLAITRSVIFAKVVVALTGLVMVGFIIGHTSGNLLIFVGQDAINTYAQGLKDIGAALWVVRSALIISVVLHIYYTLKLTALNKAAKPIGYKKTTYKRSTFASRNMTILGLTILFFIIYHLLHYTFQVTHPQFKDLQDSLGRHDVYNMIVAGFQNPIICIFYILGVLGLGYHLRHGIQSMIHTIGLNSDSAKKYSNLFAKLITIFAVVGLGSIPISVLIGLVGGK